MNYQDPNQQNNPNGNFYQQYYQMPVQPVGKGLSVAALVLGIISIAMVSLVAGIVGIVLGAKARSQTARAYGRATSMATAGFVCSVIGTVVAALYCIAVVWLVVLAILSGPIFY